MTIQDIQKVHSKRNTKVRNSWGIFDAFRQVRREGWPEIGKTVEYKLFSDIVSKVNEALAKRVILGKPVKLPERMGIIEIRKKERFLRIKNGKLFTNMPVNWRATVKLWEEDEEARRDKSLIRFENDIYSTHYSKYGATYNNQIFYTFQLTRAVKRALSKSVRDGKTDAFLYYKTIKK